MMATKDVKLAPLRDLILVNGRRIRIYCDDESHDEAWEEMIDAFARQDLWHIEGFADRNGGGQLEADFNGVDMSTIDMAKVIGYE